MKIKFESDDDLPLGKILNIPMCVKIGKSAFEENGKYHPQVHLINCFFSMTIKMEMILMLFVKIL